MSINTERVRLHLRREEQSGFQVHGPYTRTCTFPMTALQIWIAFLMTTLPICSPVPIPRLQTGVWMIVLHQCNEILYNSDYCPCWDQLTVKAGSTPLVPYLVAYYASFSNFTFGDCMEIKTGGALEMVIHFTVFGQNLKLFRRDNLEICKLRSR